jgi:hypothetical protein
MTQGYPCRWTARAAWLAAALGAMTLAGCAQSAGYGGSVPSAGYAAPDPYHYRCSANCRGQAGG